MTDGNTLKTKLGIFIDEQGATSVERLWRGPQTMKNWESLV